MKKTVLICLMILGALSSYEQTPVPNFGFESWSLYNGRLVPNNWLVRDTTASRTTDKFAGSYAVKIQNIILPGDTSKGTLCTLPPDSSEGFQPSIPVSVRHSTLNGYYKFTSLNGDSCQFIVFMYKHGFINPPSFNFLGGSWKCQGASPIYAPFTLNINYWDSLGTIVPDSALIDFSAYKALDFTTGIELNPLGNSVLLLDNISFDGFITDINNIPDLVNAVNVYPIPASTLLNIQMDLVESEYYMNMYDLNGRLVKTIANGKLSGQQQISINIENIPVGDYILMISTNEGYFSKKISIIK
jgi:hypothetical protein